MAKLYFKYSAMNAGKSTALLQAAHNYEERDQKAFLIKPKIDTKGDNKIVSRIGADREVDLMLDKEDTVIIPDDIDVILVDEAQFLTEEQVNELYFYYSKHKDTTVLCYGLRSDFMTNFFPGSKRLMEIADNIEELKTMCRCGKKAVFNGRKVNGEFIFEGDQVVIDGADDEVEYESLCGMCYTKKKDVYVKKLSI